MTRRTAAQTNPLLKVTEPLTNSAVPVISATLATAAVVTFLPMMAAVVKCPLMMAAAVVKLPPMMAAAVKRPLMMAAAAVKRPPMMAVAELELIHTPPASPSADRPPLLFVHGAWHGVWCWRTHFMPWFAAHGWDCYAFSLRGHGDSGGREQLRWASAADYVSDLSQIIQAMPAPPVLVAHSMGGYVAQRFLLEADACVAGVALLASVPAHGSLLLVLRMLGYAPLDVLRVLTTLSTRDVVARPARARHWLFSEDIDDEALLPVLPKIQDESFRVLLDTLVLRLPAPKRARAAHPDLPMLVLGAEDDRVFSAGEMRALAAAYRADCVILPRCAHDLMLDTRWQSAADALASWLCRCFG